MRNWTPREVREARNNVPPPPSSLARVSQQIHQEEEEEEEENESPLVNDQSAKQVWSRSRNLAKGCKHTMPRKCSWSWLDGGRVRLVALHAWLHVVHIL